jgi:hypothetical protein
MAQGRANRAGKIQGEVGQGVEQTTLLSLGVGKMNVMLPSAPP